VLTCSRMDSARSEPSSGTKIVLYTVSSSLCDLSIV
jgi:hypothetical protein